MRDAAAEKKWKFSLAESLAKARAGPLFDGLTFLIAADDWEGKPSGLKEGVKSMIEAAGGKVTSRGTKVFAAIGVKARKGVKNYDPEAVLMAVLTQSMDHFCEQHEL